MDSFYSTDEAVQIAFLILFCIDAHFKLLALVGKNIIDELSDCFELEVCLESYNELQDFFKGHMLHNNKTKFDNLLPDVQLGVLFTQHRWVEPHFKQHVQVASPQVLVIEVCFRLLPDDLDYL